MKRAIHIATGFLAILGIATAFEHFADADHYNPGFDAFPLTIRSHVVLGAVYLGLALLQFSPRVRSRWPGLHRACGRIAVLVGLVTGATALVIVARFPYAGPAEIAIVGPFAGVFVFALVRGVWLARARRYAEHREWMIRAMAVATAIATMRLIFVPLLIVLGGTEEVARWLSLTSFGVAFVLHSSVAELWIRRSRRPEVPVREATGALARRRRPSAATG